MRLRPLARSRPLYPVPAQRPPSFRLPARLPAARPQRAPSAAIRPRHRRHAAQVRPQRDQSRYVPGREGGPGPGREGGRAGSGGAGLTRVAVPAVYLRCTGGEVGATSALAPKIGPLGLVRTAAPGGGAPWAAPGAAGGGPGLRRREGAGRWGRRRGGKSIPVCPCPAVRPGRKRSFLATLQRSTRNHASRGVRGGAAFI